jgi:hypothetical protein
MFKKILLLTATVLLYQCTVQNSPSYVEAIVLTNDMFEFKPSQLSDFASDITYIPLETNENSVIQRVDKVMLYKEYCIILDRLQGCILVFDTLGNFRHKIDKKGHGPGEYVSIWDATVLDDGSICLLDGENKLIRYSQYGKFLNEKTYITEQPTTMGVLNGKYPVSLSVFGAFAFNDGLMLSIYDTLFHPVNRLVDRSFEKISKREAAALPSHRFSFLANCLDTLSFWEHRYDTVYRIVDSNTCIPRYCLKYDNKLPVNMQVDHGDVATHKYTNIEHLIETQVFFFITISVRNHTHQIIYNKNTRHGKSIPEVIYEIYFAGVLNDMDGGWRFWPRGVVDENRVYDYFYAYNIKQHMNNEKWISKNPLYPEKQKRIAKFAETANMEDNPVIAIVTCKTQ